MGSVAKNSEAAACTACGASAEAGGYPGLCGRCEAVLLAAHALLGGGYDRESTIIPTLVFAAIATEDARFREWKKALTAFGRDSDAGSCVRQRPPRAFDSMAVWDVFDDVPIIWRDPTRISYEHAPEDVAFADGVGEHERDLQKAGRICIDILEVSVKPKEVSEAYRTTLNLLGLEEGLSEEGSVGWQAISGIIHMTVHPGLVDPSTDAITRHVENGPHAEPEHLAFPAAELVGEMYAVLRGSRGKGKFQGIGFDLAGSRTRQAEAKTLVPACVAWFLAGEDAGPAYQTKARVTEVLNKQLLRPRGLKEASVGGGDFNQLWRDVKKHEAGLRQLKHDVSERLRRSQFIDGYFSGRAASGNS